MLKSATLSLTLAAGLLPAIAAAQNYDTGAEWQGNVTLYGWMPTLGGTQAGPDDTPKIDLDAENVIDALNGAFFGTANFQKGKFGVWLDLVYADISSTGSLHRLGLPVDVGTKVPMGTIAATYRVYENDGAWVEALGGLRSFKVDVSGSLDLPRRSIDRDASANWVDPIIGLRGAMPLGHSFGIGGTADIGGFSVGSKLTWELAAHVSYDFTENFAGVLGYRYISIDYSGSDLALDMDLYGPLAGLTWKF
jgi:opacity protein-like surface antigen